MIELLSTNEYIVYGIGLLAFLVMATSFQLNNRQHILYLQVLAMGLLGTHLFLLEAMTGALLMLIMMIRNLVFAQKQRYPWAKHDLVLYGFLGVVTFAGVFTWDGWVSLSAIMGALFATYGFWVNEPRRIRFIILLSAVAWAPYGILTESYPMVLLQIFVITSILIAMYRYDWRQKVVS